MEQLSTAKITYLRSLRHRKYRIQFHVYVLEGWKAIKTVMSKGIQPEMVVITDKEAARGVDGPFRVDFVTSERVMKSISSLHTSPGILAVFSIPKEKALPTTAPKNVVVMLDRIKDPGNLGTMIRTADWFGVKMMILNAGCCDVYNSKALQAAMGSHVNLDFYQCELDELAARWTDSQKIGLHMEGEGPNGLILEPNTSAILTVGSESSGLSPEILSQLDRKVCLQGSPTKLADSLNAAQSFTLALYVMNSG